VQTGYITIKSRSDCECGHTFRNTLWADTENNNSTLSRYIILKNPHAINRNQV